MESKLEDLDYADDIELLTSTRDHRKQTIWEIVGHAEATGLKINVAKTNAMGMNTNNIQDIESARTMCT
jgi:hypothetical protein